MASRASAIEFLRAGPEPGAGPGTAIEFLGVGAAIELLRSEVEAAMEFLRSGVATATAIEFLRSRFGVGTAMELLRAVVSGRSGGTAYTNAPCTRSPSPLSTASREGAAAASAVGGDSGSASRRA